MTLQCWAWVRWRGGPRQSLRRGTARAHGWGGRWPPSEGALSKDTHQQGDRAEDGALSVRGALILLITLQKRGEAIRDGQCACSQHRPGFVLLAAGPGTVQTFCTLL